MRASAAKSTNPKTKPSKKSDTAGAGIELQELIKRAQAGDNEAFEQLLGQFYNPVFGLLCKWTGNWQDAEDLTQDTFLKVYKYLKSFHSGENFKSWIYKIAVNLASDHHAASRRRPQMEELDETVQQHISMSTEAGERVRQQQMIRQIYRVLPELTARERSVFVLKAMESMENHEIARVLGITETTVRRFYGLARRKILHEVEQKKPEGGSTK